MSKAAKIAIVICSVAAVSVLVLGIAFARWLERDLAPTDYQDSSVLAFGACQEFVEKNLKVPGSAEWPDDAERDSEPLGDGRFRVRSRLVAKNQFGVSTRILFDCVVRKTAAGWHLETLSTE